jgi:hypothetical protein
VQEALFPGPALRASGGVRAQAVPARGVRSWGVREQREPGQRRGCGGSVPAAAGGRHQLVWSCSQPGVHVGAVFEWACGGLVDAVSARGEGSGMCAHLGPWAGAVSGSSFRAAAAVAVWGIGLLLLGERVVAETFLTVRTLRVARS